MKNKKIILSKILSALFFFLFIASVAKAQQKEKNHHHILWKMTSKTGKVTYLVGSVHTIKPSAYPLDQVYQKAFNKADELVFEINLDSLKANRLPLIRRYGFLSNGQTLKSNLSPEVYGLVKSRLDSLGLPVARFQQMKPWLVSVTIMDMTFRKAGYRAGIDQHFFEKAKKAGKPRIGLETPAYQMGLLDSLSSELTKDFVKHNIEKADRSLLQIDHIVSAWKNGNVAQLDSLIIKEMKQTNPVLYKGIVLKRNRKWMPKIKQLMNDGQTTMIVVGAGHLIGDNGLVADLRKDGYKVEQL